MRGPVLGSRAKLAVPGCYVRIYSQLFSCFTDHADNFNERTHLSASLLSCVRMSCIGVKATIGVKHPTNNRAKRFDCCVFVPACGLVRNVVNPVPETTLRWRS